MDEINEEDVAILILLAARPSMSARDRAKFFGELSGPALQIARALTRINKRPTKKIRDLADEIKAMATKNN